jgi:hypothetical protein
MPCTKSTRACSPSLPAKGEPSNFYFVLVEDSEAIASAVVDLVAERLPRDGQRIPRQVDTQPLHTYVQPAANADPLDDQAMVLASAADMGVNTLMRRSMWRGAFSAADL